MASIINYHHLPYNLE